MLVALGVFSTSAKIGESAGLFELRRGREPFGQRDHTVRLALLRKPLDCAEDQPVL